MKNIFLVDDSIKLTYDLDGEYYVVGISGANPEVIERQYNYLTNYGCSENEFHILSDTFGYFSTNQEDFINGLETLYFCRSSHNLLRKDEKELKLKDWKELENMEHGEAPQEARKLFESIPQEYFMHEIRDNKPSTKFYQVAIRRLQNTSYNLY